MVLQRLTTHGDLGKKLQETVKCAVRDAIIPLLCSVAAKCPAGEELRLSGTYAAVLDLGEWQLVQQLSGCPCKCEVVLRRAAGQPDASPAASAVHVMAWLALSGLLVASALHLVPTSPNHHHRCLRGCLRRVPELP